MFVIMRCVYPCRLVQCFNCTFTLLIPRASSWAASSSLSASPWRLFSSSSCGLLPGCDRPACPRRSALGPSRAGGVGSSTGSSARWAELSSSPWASCGWRWKVAGPTWRRRRCWWWRLTAAFWTWWFCVQPSWQRWCPGRRTPACRS